MVRSSIVIAALALPVRAWVAARVTRHRSATRHCQCGSTRRCAQPSARLARPAPVAVPDNPIDKAIRRDLSLAISRRCRPEKSTNQFHCGERRCERQRHGGNGRRAQKDQRPGDERSGREERRERIADRTSRRRRGLKRQERAELGKGKTKDLREANENIRKAQDGEATKTDVDPKKAGNRPRFDRDR